MDARQPSPDEPLRVALIERPGNTSGTASRFTLPDGWERADLASPLAATAAFDGEPPNAVIVSVADAPAREGGMLQATLDQLPHIPVFALLGIRSSKRIVAALDAGAADVLWPGMEPAEVGARVARRARRGGSGGSRPLEHGRLLIDRDAAEVRWDGEPLDLTGRERGLLTALLADEGRPVRREALYERVWGFAMARGDRVVDVNIRRLRHRLEAVTGDGLQIDTVTGVGYRLRVGAAEPATATEQQ